MKITRCKYCNKILALSETAWSAQTGMFCSKECGVLDAMTLYDDEKDGIVGNIEAAATSFFEDIAEEISREDYGAYDVRWTAYSSPSDITVILHSINEAEELIYTEVTGWYFGMPDAESTELYDGKLRATFID